MNEANGKSVDRPCGRIKMVPIYASDDVIDEVKIVAFDSEKKKFVLRVNIKQFTKRGCRRLETSSVIMDWRCSTKLLQPAGFCVWPEKFSAPILLVMKLL